MIAFPCILLAPAKEAGMAVPDEYDVDEFDAEEFPHFAVYCNMQLGRSMPSSSAHWANAKVVAAIPLDRIKTITGRELLMRGFQ